MLDAHYGCDVKKLEYDFDSKQGKLTIVGCSNMTSVIELFQAIDYHVILIETINEKGYDTAYGKEEDGKWVAMTSDGRKSFRGGFYR